MIPKTLCNQGTGTSGRQRVDSQGQASAAGRGIQRVVELGWYGGDDRDQVHGTRSDTDPTLIEFPRSRPRLF